MILPRIKVQSETKRVQNETISKIIRIFAPDMYTLTDIIGQDARELWQGKVACQMVNSVHIQVGEFLDGVSVFSFLMIVRGTLSVDYCGRRIDLSQGDLHTYAPGLPTTMLEVSEDYEAFLLNIDEQTVYETPALQHIIRAAYFPVAEMGQPKLTLTGTQVMQLTTLFTMLRSHILEPSSFQQEAILALCQLISVNILEIQDQQVENHHFTTRAEEVFKAFLRLVPQHFMEHRDLAFYADRLHITTTYLSRIVRQMSGRTVQDFLAQALAAEAAIRLKTTNRSITQLADVFHFSDQAAFTKFFTRMKGVSPKEFRKGKQ
jgi:AraC-like DNA-binding protein